MKRYVHFRPFCNVKTVHSLIAEYYRGAASIGMQSGELMIVQSYAPPLEPQGLQSIEEVEVPNADSGDIFRIAITVCFNNRSHPLRNGLHNPTGGRYQHPRDLTSSAALNKLCEKAGLVPVEKRVGSFGVMTKKIGTVNLGLFQAHNVFDISGNFYIDDPELFQEAIKNGIGSRKSYGFGMIVFQSVAQEEQAYSRRTQQAIDGDMYL